MQSPPFPLLAIAALTLTVTPPAFAGGHFNDNPAMDMPDRPDGPPLGWSAGLGVIASNGIYVGEDASYLPVPIIRYEGERFSFGLPDGARLTLWDQGDLRLSGVVTPRFNDIGGSDAVELAGLDRDQITADGGVMVEYGFGFGTEISATALTELTGAHGGSEIKLSIEQPLPLGGIPIFLGAGLSWQDDKLASFLYGVSASEATGTRAAYSPGDVLIPSISIGTAIPISERVSLFGNVSAEFLPDEVKNSSIIDEDLSIQGVLGMSYRF